MTQPTKQQFFAQYWGQKVFKPFGSAISEPLSEVSFIQWSLSKSYVELLDIKNITDEDAIEVAKALGLVNAKIYRRIKSYISIVDDSYTLYFHVDGFVALWKDGGLINESTLIAYDILRSKGYALPYLKYSVEQLIEMGWVKLKSK